MLVLSRVKSQWIDIRTPNGDVISICVVSVRGNKTRIGIDAPPQYKALRRELGEPKDETKRNDNRGKVSYYLADSGS